MVLPLLPRSGPRAVQSEAEIDDWRNRFGQGLLPVPPAWNPQQQGAPGVEQAPFVGQQPGFGQGLQAIDPVAGQAIVRLGLTDPDKFAAIMASSGAEPPPVEKSQDRLPPAAIGPGMAPKRVPTQTIRPDQTPPAPAAGGSPLDRIQQASEVIQTPNVREFPGPLETQVQPGATYMQTLGDLINAGPEQDLVALPAESERVARAPLVTPGMEPPATPPPPVEDVLAGTDRPPRAEDYGANLPDVPLPPDQMEGNRADPDYDMFNPDPIAQRPPEPPAEVTTGTNEPTTRDRLGSALLGLRMPPPPEAPRPPSPPSVPRPSQPIQPAATLMSLLLGSLGRNKPQRLGV